MKYPETVTYETCVGKLAYGTCTYLLTYDTYTCLNHLLAYEIHEIEWIASETHGSNMPRARTPVCLRVEHTDTVTYERCVGNQPMLTYETHGHAETHRHGCAYL